MASKIEAIRAPMMMPASSPPERSSVGTDGGTVVAGTRVLTLKSEKPSLS